MGERTGAGHERRAAGFLFFLRMNRKVPGEAGKRRRRWPERRQGPRCCWGARYGLEGRQRV